MKITAYFYQNAASFSTIGPIVQLLIFLQGEIKTENPYVSITTGNDFYLATNGHLTRKIPSTTKQNP